MHLLRTIRNILSNVLLAVIAAICLVFILPVWLLRLPFNLYKERRLNAAFQEYLRVQEGRRYFVYNSKRKIQEFIEIAIIPFLDKDIKIVYRDGRLAFTDEEANFIGRLIHWQKLTGGYPYVIEINEGKPRVFSYNSAVYKAMKDGDAAGLLAKINF